MPKHLKQISGELVHENPWWKYHHDTFEKPNGETGDYWYGEKPNSALIVPVMPDGKIALILQHRYLSDKQSIEFPSGAITSDVQVIDGAKRELYEETGLAGEEWIHIGEFGAMPGYFKAKTYVYIAHVDQQGAQELDDTEDMEVLYRRPDEFQEMVERHEIWDAQTLAGWAMVAHYFDLARPHA